MTVEQSSPLHAWLDVSAGVAGDMLLGALVDAGAALDQIQAAIDALIPGAVRLRRSEVNRGGQRAAKVDVDLLVDDPPHRTWASIRAMLADADLAPITRQRALATFARLADAEGFVHGVPADEVHFHEVGALDSIADVVGCCEALRLLGVETITASPVAVGSGRIKIAHGHIPVPVPAVVQLSLDWPIAANPQRTGEDPRPVGELATPTGVALVRALSEKCQAGPSFTLRTVGIGAGTKDTDGWPNVVRVMIGDVHSPTPDANSPSPDRRSRSSDPRSLSSDPRSLSLSKGETPPDTRSLSPSKGETPPPSPAASTTPVDTGDLERAIQLEANVDDLDPRLWPGVLQALLTAGAMDAWLVPILMKKGRPAHTLCVLSAPEVADRISEVMFAETSTIGIRQHQVARRVLARRTLQVEVGADAISIKVSHRAGNIVQATPEFDEVAAIAATQGIPTADVLALVHAAMSNAGLASGCALADVSAAASPTAESGHDHSHSHDHLHDHAHGDHHPPH